MLTPNLVIFYVQDPIKSMDFYEKIFSIKPTAAFPSYVAFTFDNGFTFSLWSTTAKDFVSEGSGHRSELSFMVPDEATVTLLRKQWGEFGVQIEQDLKIAVFGLTFVALDPDGHRIRVCIPDQN